VLLRAEALLVWGWRVPFLLAIVTLFAAVTLRYNMPESQEVGSGGHVTMGRVRSAPWPCHCPNLPTQAVCNSIITIY
jgi:hypothetical protein